MSGKFKLLLGKREAETYRSHGLYKEAMDVYTELLKTDSNIDPDVKILIQKKIQTIEDEKQEFSDQRESALSPQDIKQIMQGWDDVIGEADLLACIHVLCSVNSYADAWEELKKLLTKNGLKENYLKLVVDCLVNLFNPAQLPDIVNKLVFEGLPQQDDPLACHLTLARHLADHSHNEWAIMLYCHLYARGDLSEETAAHIVAALQQLEPAACETAPACQPVPDGDVEFRSDDPADTSHLLDRCKSRLIALFNALKKWRGN